jgi:molybdopterin/thiamine biosynthesis adenylyltransferase
MNSINTPEFSRNFGFWSPAEQQSIMGSHVAIGGVGGDGYQLGLKLARMGVGELSVAEVFELENINRVPGATVDTVGRKKVDVFREDARKINPDIRVHIYDEGITEDNVDAFVQGTNLVLDETELTHLELGTMLARAARRANVPDMLVMNIGFAAQVTSFHPKGKTFEDLMGIPREMPLDEVKEQPLNLARCVPYLPPYADIQTLKAVQEGAPLPSISQGVDVASAMGASQALLHMTRDIEPNRPQPVWSPRIAYMDALTFKADVTRFPRLSHYRYLATMVGREMLHKNVKTRYAASDRKQRAEAHAAEQSIGSDNT